jgi:hypothetical protein
MPALGTMWRACAARSETHAVPLHHSQLRSMLLIVSDLLTVSRETGALSCSDWIRSGTHRVVLQDLLCVSPGSYHALWCGDVRRFT